MRQRKLLRGTELRYVLTAYIAAQGPQTVESLLDYLDYHDFDVPGRPSKTVSDALRWERRRGRVRRLRRAHYGPGAMPRSTESYIHKRAMALRDQAAEIAVSGDSEDAYYQRLYARLEPYDEF